MAMSIISVGLCGRVTVAAQNNRISVLNRPADASRNGITLSLVSETLHKKYLQPIAAAYNQQNDVVYCRKNEIRHIGPSP